MIKCAAAIWMSTAGCCGPWGNRIELVGVQASRVERRRSGTRGGGLGWAISVIWNNQRFAVVAKARGFALFGGGDLGGIP